MIVAVALAFPVLLILLPLGMDRLERNLARGGLGSDLEEFLFTARPEEVETFVAAGFAPALDAYWARRAPRRNRPTASSRSGGPRAAPGRDAAVGRPYR